MLLEGHTDPLFTCKFSPDGAHIASAGADKTILIWHVYGECENHTALKGHTNSILQLNWNGSSDLLFSASTDNTAIIWNIEYGVRIKRIKDHSSFINSIYATKFGEQYFSTVSDDGTAKIYDLRIKQCLKRFDGKYQMTACAVSDGCLQLYTGGIDNDIKIWDCRKMDHALQSMSYHSDTVTSLNLNKGCNKLLSNAMDGFICVWDIQSYVSSIVSNSMMVDDENNHSLLKNDHRLIRIFKGAQHGQERLLIKSNWNSDGSKICSGSSDRMVYIFDYESGEIEYKLPGHKGSVNEVDYHPLEPIVVSCSSDSNLYLGEL